jgi:hypothetical protein
LYLLRQIRREYEEKSALGSYIHPGTVLRCDGTDLKHAENPDLTAIFVSFPYFDIGRGSPSHTPEDESMHVPRGLFQSTYPQEAAQERDADQMFRRFKHGRTEDFYAYLSFGL